MPLVEIKLLEEVFSPEEKRELIERCTDVIAGNGLRTEDAQELIAAPAAA